MQKHFGNQYLETGADRKKDEVLGENKMSLIAKEIVFSYEKKGIVLLDHFGIEVKPNERVGIFAPSGFGKTTLMKIIAGYLKPKEGEIYIDGEKPPKKGYYPVQMIWQHPEKAVNPRMRMKEILAEGDQIEEEMLKKLGIRREWIDRYPGELSGGELQRFCIARALGKRTKYLIADEITTMLDVITGRQIWNFLLEETERRQIGMLIVSHKKELLDEVCTRQISLWKEKIKN